MPLPFHRRRLDPDAADFCRRSGATDRAAINAFVKGVKDLGLWNSMVCWPLRSSQNAGTGTTAYSLGGLGTFNGTLVNGPTWGSDGVNFNKASNQSVTTTRQLNFSQTSTVIASAKRISQGILSPRILALAESQATPMYVGAQNTGPVGAWHAIGSTFDPLLAPADNTFNVITLSIDATTLTGTLNASSPASVAYTPRNVSGNLQIAASSALAENSRWDGPIAFVGYINSATASGIVAQLHALYKQTLGTGLGLP